MAEHEWERVVERYLTCDRSVFVNTSYLIGERKKWEAYPDMIALDFRERTAWMVEVKSGHSRDLLQKAADFEQDYAPRIRQNLTDDHVFPDIGVWENWSLSMWAFVPSWAK